jgi:pentose-5-phosphate-3-epimerase
MREESALSMQRQSFVAELRQAAPLLSVGILTADMMSLGSELALIQEAGVRLVHFDIMDGGITRNNVAEVARMGADIIVTGSAVFDGKNPGENAAFMLDAVRGTVRESRRGEGA